MFKYRVIKSSWGKMKLQYKITLFILIILLVAGAVGAIVTLRSQRQAAISQFEESALALAWAFQNSLEYSMLKADREHIQEVVARMASGHLINELVILSNTQKVYVSGRISEIGAVRNDKEIARALASGETVTRTKEMYGRDELSVILPVTNKPECYSCHGSEAMILGAIEIGLDKGSLDAQIREQTMLMALIGVITLVAIGAAMSFMFRSAIVNPLSKLAASARRIARGDFSARAEVERKDEVGMVASTFNEMAKRVEQHARTLEEKVQQRTQQVQQMATARGQLLERLISAQEEERRRIARELHDEAGQALTRIMMDLARALEALPSEATEAREKLSQSRSLAAQTLAELRKLIYDLRPEVLDQLGLVPALRSYAKSRLGAENIEVRLIFSGLTDRVSPQLELTLFRIIQEAITNIIRHSGASRVNIQVTLRESVITAAVEDNGRGFDVEAALQAPDSWGLRGIRERVAVVGGKLNIESEIGKGTRVQFQIPLEGV